MSEGVPGSPRQSRSPINRATARADRNLQASWATLIFYQLSLACSKISILLLYLRVLTYNWARRAAWVLFGIVVVYNIVYLISTVTLCIPLEALWDKAVKGKCHTGPVYMWVAISFHIVTDFLMFALPLPVVILMTLALSRRIMLLSIFALGFLYVKAFPSFNSSASWRTYLMCVISCCCLRLITFFSLTGPVSFRCFEPC